MNISLVKYTGEVSVRGVVDQKEQDGDSRMGLLRTAFGKTVHLSYDKGVLKATTTQARLADRVMAFVLFILFLPITGFMTMSGYGAYDKSESRKFMEGRVKGLTLPEIKPSDADHRAPQPTATIDISQQQVGTQALELMQQIPLDGCHFVMNQSALQSLFTMVGAARGEKVSTEEVNLVAALFNGGSASSILTIGKASATRCDFAAGAPEEPRLDLVISKKSMVNAAKSMVNAADRIREFLSTIPSVPDAAKAALTKHVDAFSSGMKAVVALMPMDSEGNLVLNLYAFMKEVLESDSLIEVLKNAQAANGNEGLALGQSSMVSSGGHPDDVER